MPRTYATSSGGVGGVTDVTATSPIISSGGATPDISTSMSTNKLIGRGTAGTGVMEEITLGTGLSFTGTTLNATASAGGINTQLQYNNSGVLGGITGATTNGTTVTFATNGISADNIKASTSAGLLLQSDNGTNILLLGAGGGDNATFYGGVKLDAQTASRILSTDSSKNITALDTATYPDLTELSYVKGVTSAIQTQLNAKVPTSRTLTINGTGYDLSADRSWTISATPAGSDTQVQFNDGGALGADSGLVFDKTNDILTVGARLRTGAGTAALPSLASASEPSNGIYFPAGNNVYIATNGIARFAIQSNGNFIFVPGGTTMMQVGSAGVGIAGLNSGYSGTFNVQNIGGQTTKVTEIIKAIASQTANLTTWQDSAGSLVAGMSASGNLGLGITPAERLHVYQAATNAFALIEAGGTNYAAQMRFKTTVREFRLGYVPGISAFNIYDNTAAATRLAIDNNGKVGIGTTAPDKQLEINSADGNNLRLTYNDANGSAANYVDFLTSSTGDLTITPSGGDISLGSANLTTSGVVQAQYKSSDGTAGLTATKVFNDGAVVNTVTIKDGLITDWTQV